MRKCFAQVKINDKCFECDILSSQMDKPLCPFCKPCREVTNGMTYCKPLYYYEQIKAVRKEELKQYKEITCRRCKWHKQETPSIVVCMNAKCIKYGCRVKKMPKDCSAFEGLY